MKTHAFLASLMVAFLVALDAVSAPQVRPTVDYSADMTITAGKEKGTARIYHSGEADRRDMEMAGQKMTMISNADQFLMIVPGTGMALRMAVPRDPVSQVYERAESARFEAVGKEVVAGEATTKYRINEPEAQGHVWLTDDGIVMRARMTSDHGDVAIDVTSLKRGPQDPALFQPPAGLMIMDMEQMRGIGGTAMPPGIGK
ncbi:MAG: DUF4412 domain-containing protein [Alphaproteobacteria bacterium]|nr:MAG: DUF4412 domain-containing protein [Alphaproteobacteria bacterium]